MRQAASAAGRRPDSAPAAAQPLPAGTPRMISATGYGPADDAARGYKDPPPDVAYELNRARPLSSLPNPPGRPFVAAFRDEFDQARALDCLTAAVYYEAATEPGDGQRAVAQVVLNRVRHPAFAKNVCAVVFEGSERTSGCQFTFTCDGSLARPPVPELWEKARKVAAAALAGSVYKPVGYATHYHTVWVAPYWSPSLVKVANVGQHIFYRWDGGWGTPAAFNARYEPDETAVDVRRLAAVAPLAVQKAIHVIQAPPKAPDPEPAETASRPKVVLVSAEPLELAAAATPLVLPKPEIPQATVVAEAPANLLSRPQPTSRLAVPAGW